MPCRAPPRSSPTCATAVTRRSSTGRSASTASGRRLYAFPRTPSPARRPSRRFLAALRRLAVAVRAFHEPQRPADTTVSTYPGVESSRRFLPIGAVGVYAPGGRAAYPSSLVMAVVPAQLAGVQRIAVVSPRPPAVLLAAARELGIDEIYAVGGAQAIAALAYGTETIPAVDKIVGPGNRWVAAAKLLVSGRVGIDLPAGPSEVLIVADETADAELCAADLLAQAEHGPDSECILVTTSAALAADVERLDGGLGAGADRGRRLARRGARALRRVRARAPRAPRRRSSRGRGAGAGTRARSSSDRRPPRSSATTRRGPTTCCRRAVSRAPPAGWASKRS